MKYTQDCIKSSAVLLQVVRGEGDGGLGVACSDPKAIVEVVAGMAQTLAMIADLLNEPIEMLIQEKQHRQEEQRHALSLREGRASGDALQ